MENKIVERFINYAKIYSPSYKEKDFATTLIKDLEELGADIVVDDAGKKIGSNCGNLIAFIKGTLDKEPILLSAHMDTVTPCENITPIIDGDKIISNGDTILSADDKAGIVAIIEGIKYAKHNNLPHRDIEIAFMIGEEVGLLGSSNIDYSQFRSKIGYVFDGDGKPGIATVKAPAHANLIATFEGVPAHAGLEPEKGISAIQMAADAISNMRLLRIDEESSANVGTIHGGKADNIVAQNCKVTLEARSLSNEKIELIISEMISILENSANKFGGSVKIERDQYDALNINSNNIVLEHLKRSCLDCGLEYGEESSGGGSDASNIHASDINCVCVGVGMQKVHSTNEYILIQDLLDSVKLVTSLITI